jgi:hypothetical protein
MSMLRKNAARLLALVAIAIATLVTIPPGYSDSEQARLAAQFRFRSLPLPSASTARKHYVRNVEPQLRHIRAWISAVGAGVSLFAPTSDSLPNDVCLVDPRTNSVTVEPAPGTGARFTPFVLDPRPLPYDGSRMAPTGCLPGQYAEDGRTDLLVYYWGRAPVLFLNDGQSVLSRGSFTAQELVPNGDRQRWYTDSIDQADIDGDGHPDLIVGNYFPDGSRVLDPRARSDPAMQMQGSMSRAYNGGNDHIYLWRSGHGGSHPAARFQLSRGALSPRVSAGWTLAIGAAALTSNGLPAVYFGNDFGPDHLLLNQSTPGHVRLSEVTGRRGFFTPASDVLGRDSFKGMGVTFADLLGNGRLDILVSNITTQFGLEESNFAFMNTGGALSPGQPAPFADRADAMGLAHSGWSWDVKAGDLNDAGRPEIVQAVGFVRGRANRWAELQELAMVNDTLLRHPANWPNFAPGVDLSGHEQDAFFVPGPGGRYVDLADRVGLSRQPGVSRGVALADVFGNGLLDFAVANQWARSTMYLNRSRRRGAYLGLNLVVPLGTEAPGSSVRVRSYPNVGLAARPAVGAEAWVNLPHRTLVQSVDGGNGHASASAPQLLFGLGPRAADRVAVHLVWRAVGGALRRARLELTPGWHTLVLGGS